MLRILYLLLGTGILSVDAFASRKTNRSFICLQAAKENKAMEFLRKIGRVGTKQDFTNAIGVDEGPSGKSNGETLKKAENVAVRSCVVTGIIDDLRQQFPMTSCGTQWSGFTDQVMGGVSVARLTREVFDGRLSNVLRGTVKMERNGGFIQMAANLKLDGTAIDASRYDGIELLVQNGAREVESFNVHIKTTDCLRPFSSYRKMFQARPRVWEKIRLPFSEFVGKGPGAESTSFDLSRLKRFGIVAIGKPMEVELAIAGVRLYGISETVAVTFQP